VNYYLTKTGFMCSDEKMYTRSWLLAVCSSLNGLLCVCSRRLVSLAAQKFVADIAEDALQYCKIRQQSPANRDKHRGKVRYRFCTRDHRALLSYH
jgi:hypothetical protein